MAGRFLRLQTTLYGLYPDLFGQGLGNKQRTLVPRQDDPRGLTNSPLLGRYSLCPQEMLLRGRDLVARQVPEVRKGPYL